MGKSNRRANPVHMTIGMDVSDRYCHVCFLDDGGNVLKREKVETRAPALQRWAAGHAGHGHRLVIEVGPHSLWMSRVLEPGFELVIANPSAVALISQSDRKTDRVDAETLARLGRVDPELLRPVKHRRPETQAALAVIRSRDTLVSARTSLINSVRGTAKAAGGALRAIPADNFSRLREELPGLVAAELEPMLVAIEKLTEQVALYDAVVERLCAEQYPETATLRQIPGVGPLTALTFVLVIEDPERFPSGAKVASYLGLRPRKSQSGDRDPELNITKAGDPLLRKLLIQCAHRTLFPLSKPTAIREWGQKLAERGGKSARKKAVVAVARKLAITMLAMLKSGADFVPHPASEAA